MTANDESRLLLVSASPRRRRLLAWLGLPFEVASVDTPESLDTPLSSDPSALASALAVEKGLAARAIPGSTRAHVLTFDTIVVLDGMPLGKPTDDEDARHMLRALSGRSHQVVTGTSIICPGHTEPRTLAVTTNVTMNELGEAEIREWMSRGEYLGCAGAYNIEGQVASVGTCECYQNVAGLPLCHLYAALRDDPSCPLPGLKPPVAQCDAALGRMCALGPLVVGEG